MLAVSVCPSNTPDLVLCVAVHRRCPNVRSSALASAIILQWLALLGLSCEGGKPSIRYSVQTAAQTSLLDADIRTVGDVITVDAGCATSTTRGRLRPSNLLFVLDRSGSMACNLPEDGQSSQNCAAFPAALFQDQPTKWELTRKAVSNAVAALREAGDVRVGITLFPESGTRCTVATNPVLPIAALDAQLEDRMEKLLAAAAPGGETPLAGATILGYAHLLQQMRAGTLDGDTFVIIVTDGYETCKTSELSKLLTLDVPNAFHGMFVRTFVIGAPGSDDGRALLSEMAVAGGTAKDPSCTFGPLPTDGNCHFDMTSTADFGHDLLDALTLINSEVMSCSVDIPTAPSGGPVNLDEVNVVINGISRPMVATTACGSASGWRYSDDLTTILLCGEACRAAKQRGAEVTVILGCPTALL